jgi:hypothetical protein
MITRIPDGAVRRCDIGLHGRTIQGMNYGLIVFLAGLGIHRAAGHERSECPGIQVLPP